MTIENNHMLTVGEIAFIIKNRVADKIKAGISIEPENWFDFARDVEAAAAKKLLPLQVPGAGEKVCEPLDKGPWIPGTTDDGRTFLQSDDFTHDVRLYVDGDFSDADEKRKYASNLADMMNLKLILSRPGSVEETDEQQKKTTP